MASSSRYDLPLSFLCKEQVIPISVRHGNFGPEFTLVVQVSVGHCKSIILLRRNPTMAYHLADCGTILAGQCSKLTLI